MSEEAFHLVEAGTQPESVRLPRLLGFFGVNVRQGTASEFVAGPASGAPRRLLGGVDQFVSFFRGLAAHPQGAALWRDRVHSAFIHGDGETGDLDGLLRLLNVGADVRVVRAHGVDEWQVAEGLPELCGPMGGLRFARGSADPPWVIVSGGAPENLTRIIASGEESVFVRILYQGVPVLIWTTPGIIDVEDEVPVRGFDVREQWAAAVPVVMYVRWAFSESCWKPKDRSACLVIDDPLLKPRYGFVNFVDLLAAMRRHRFSTSIAFIPWNWRRSRPRVVRLFREHPGQLSLSIHGCDHTAAEFGSSESGRMLHKLETAATRMDRHATETGIQHDRVMVFPQGVFSSAAMAALKRSNYVGVVNTEIASVDPPTRPLRVADVWDVAVMSYGGFPIYTRRYPWQGIENFAFDVLLGKPCLIVIHHDFCRDQNSHLVQFIERLNAQTPDLAWRSLGEVLRRGYRWRPLSPGLWEIEMYAAELFLENPSEYSVRFKLRRRESDPASVREIVVENIAVPWTHEGEFVRFDVELKARESCLVRVIFHSPPLLPERPDGLKYRMKTAIRRYLSEFRDDYVTRLKPARNLPVTKSTGARAAAVSDKEVAAGSQPNLTR